MDVQCVDDHRRIEPDVRREGVVRPDVYPRVARPNGERGFDHPGAEVLEADEDEGQHPVRRRVECAPGVENVKGGIGYATENDGRDDRSGQSQVARQQDRVDEHHHGEAGADEVDDEGGWDAEQELMARQAEDRMVEGELDS